jgi:predicted alpha/beta hydrolase family esterase
MKVNRLERYWPRPGTGEPTLLEPPERQFASRPAAASWSETISEALGDYPQATIIVALSLGVMLGWLIKRR